MTQSISNVFGGSFLVDPVATGEIFIPENFNDEQKSFAKTAQDFVEKEVLPVEERIEKQEAGLMPSLLKKAGELGLFMIDIPEKYGGMELDKSTSMLVAEKLAKSGSFSVAFGAHSGIGTLPITFFGNEEQKAKYLPLLATGEKLSAYALTEPNAGSDALSAKTKAVLSEDKKYYILNGTKQFITNSGFCDMFIVFAKVDGTSFTGFIVDLPAEGFSTGAEEKKLGIKGSSTRTLILENVKVPVENVLGEIGKGHKIAFNTLNIGRFKLGIGCIGGSKELLADSIKYAKMREQFNKPIASFGAIQSKLAKMAIKIYAGESMAYRMAGYIDEKIHNIDKSSPQATQQIIDAIEEFTIEDSIIKVFGSEVLGYCADEMVQIHGGYGYTEEYPAEKAYRDARINRIFEGTNEINRMLIPATILKRALKGTIPLMELGMKVNQEFASGALNLEVAEGPLAKEIEITERCKKIAIYVMGAVAQKFMQNIQQEQEILIMLADIIINIYGMDSALKRLLKLIPEKGEDKLAVHYDLIKCLVSEGYDEVAILAKRILKATFTDSELNKHLENINKAKVSYNYNLVQGYRNIASKLIADEKYTFTF